MNPECQDRASVDLAGYGHVAFPASRPAANPAFQASESSFNIYRPHTFRFLRS